MRKTKSMVLLALIVLSLAGCEASKGAARDLENTGENIQEGVRDVQDNDAL